MSRSSQSASSLSNNAIAYLNGRYLPVEELKLSVFDQGIVHGLAVTEMLRTFSGSVYQLQAHLQRLEISASLCHIPLRMPTTEIVSVVEHLVQTNFSRLPAGRELGVIVSATPGLNTTYTGLPADEPTLFAHTFELPGELWANATLTGLHLAVSKIPQVSDESVPVTAKSRSRLHWMLAEREVQQRYPGARAILLDQFGYVRETSTANIFVVRNQRLLTPAEETVLPGVSRRVALQLARELGIETQEGPVTIDDLLQSSEIFTTSTPYSLLGVSQLNSTAAGLEFPGPITQAILQKWNEQVGLDIHQQLRDIACQRKQSC